MKEKRPDELTHDSDPSPPVKVPYQAPTLLRRGTLRDMTLAVGYSGAKDRGRGKRKGPKRTR